MRGHASGFGKRCSWEFEFQFLGLLTIVCVRVRGTLATRDFSIDSILGGYEGHTYWGVGGGGMGGGGG